jgi:hypothetical protein
MIKMKLLEIDRVKAVWNRYAANKIIVTMIKSENIWLKWNSFDKLWKLTEMSWEITWEIQEKVFFSGKGGDSLQGLLLTFLKEREVVNLDRVLGPAFYKPEG